MNILVVGCGKVGSRLASVLGRLGHDVSVVDRDETHFDLLSPEFNGFTTLGVPIDQDVLRRAGIDGCDALAAVTEDDNTNIMVSQLAKEFFKVNTVIARIYDPRRGDVFSHFGLHTVCPTNLTVAAVCSALTDNAQSKNFNMGTHTLTFSVMPIPKDYIGNKVSDIAFEENEVLFAVERDTTTLTLIGLRNIILEKGDKLIFAKLID